MDKIWDRKILRSRRSLAVVAGTKKSNDHAEAKKNPEETTTKHLGTKNTRTA